MKQSSIHNLSVVVLRCWHIPILDVPYVKILDHEKFSFYTTQIHFEATSRSPSFDQETDMNVEEFVRQMKEQHGESLKDMPLPEGVEDYLRDHMNSEISRP